MPQAYSLMVGLTEVDESAPIYSRFFPGFKSRNGCEGSAKDVEMMERLTHYLGFTPILNNHLLNSNATRSNVRTALELAAKSESQIKAGDLFLFYLSCHGQALLAAEKREISVLVGNVVDIFMLHDGPILNLQIRNPLLQLAKRGVRVVTIIDACHSGLGLNINIPGQILGGAVSKAAQIYLTALANAALQELSQTGNIGSRSSRNQTLSIQNIQDQLKITRDEMRRAAAGTYQIVHFGASRDEGSAMGGVDGSLFTRVFNRLFISGGYQRTYQEFSGDLVQVIYRSQISQFESLDPNGMAGSEKVFQI